MITWEILIRVAELLLALVFVSAGSRHCATRNRAANNLQRSAYLCRLFSFD